MINLPDAEADAIAKRWYDASLQRAFSTQRIGRNITERAIERVYATFGFRCPQIVWLDNPQQLTYAPEIVSAGADKNTINLVSAAVSIVRNANPQITCRVSNRTYIRVHRFAELIWPILSRFAHALYQATLTSPTLDEWNVLVERLSSNNVDIDSETLQQILSSFDSPFSTWWTKGERNLIWGNWELSHYIGFMEAAGQEFGIEFLSPEREQIRSLYELSTLTHAVSCYTDLCFVIEHPVELKIDSQRLHCEFGPAVKYADGFSVYAWRGAIVPKDGVTLPATLPSIAKQPNVEVRRLLIERYGIARYVLDAGAVLLHEDEFGRLYRQENGNDEAICILEVVNKSAEIDGTYKKYFLRVPPGVRTAREAVAWTFGLLPKEYGPNIES